MLALLALGFVALSVCSVLFLRTGSGLICLWLANVFAAALLIRNASMPLPAAGAVLLACGLITNSALGNTPGMSLLFAAANTLSVVTGTALVRWRGSWRTAADAGLASYMETLLLSGLVAPAVAAVFFASHAVLLGHKAFGEGILTWWAGDALSFGVLLPCLLFATRANLHSLGKDRRSIFVVTSALGCSAFALAAVAWGNFAFVLMMVPLLLAAALSRPFEMAIISGVTGATLIAAGMTGLVPVLDTMTGFANGYQLAVAVAVVLPFLACLVIERSREDQRRIALSEQRFRRAMQDSAIGVAIVALDGRIVEANPMFASMLGYTTDDLETMTFMQISSPDDAAIGVETTRKVRAGEAHSYHFEKRYMHKNGHPVWAQVAGSVISDERTGAPLYLVSQIEDIDARKKAAAAISEAETRWNFALASAGQGVWDLDLKNGRTYYSAIWKEMLGYADDELNGDPELWLGLLHPEDREKVEAADKAHLEGRAQFFEAEFRMRHKDGHWVWILDRGKALERDENGRAVRAIGTHTDITSIKKAEESLALSAKALAEEKERLRVTLQSIGDAVICTDASSRVTFMNPTAEKLVRCDAAAAIGKPLDGVYRPVDEETGVPLRAGSAEAGATEHNSRAALIRNDGSRCSIREVVSPILTEAGEFGGSVIVFQDFTDARTLQRELAYAASHDALTGIANRSSFLQAMGKLAAEARREGVEHQFLYIDLDRFKEVNDTAGHAAGDALLKSVTDTIRASVRPGDMVARLGGDEFAVIFRACPTGTAKTLADGLVDAIANLDFRWHGRSHPIGASIGIAALRADGGAVDEVIARADEACYSAKAAGRGCVAVYDMKAATRHELPVAS